MLQWWWFDGAVPLIFDGVSGVVCVAGDVVGFGGCCGANIAVIFGYFF